MAKLTIKKTPVGVDESVVEKYSAVFHHRDTLNWRLMLQNFLQVTVEGGE